MTPAITVDHWACDLCPRLRPKEQRAVGVDWIDGYWACELCLGAYALELIGAGGRGHVPA
jgi:hypothetical protein